MKILLVPALLLLVACGSTPRSVVETETPRSTPTLAPPINETPPVLRQFVPVQTTKVGVRLFYYPNCGAARKAGVAPLRRGEPGYRSALDRNGDGVACE